MRLLAILNPPAALTPKGRVFTLRMVAMAMMSCLLSPTTNQHLSLQGFVRKEKNKPTNNNNKTLSISFFFLQDHIWFSLSHLFMPESSKTFLRSLMEVLFDPRYKIKTVAVQLYTATVSVCLQVLQWHKEGHISSLGNHILLENIYS